jgi:hypothetical protein
VCLPNAQGDQEGLFELVILNFIFKWYNWTNCRFDTDSLSIDKYHLTFQIELNMLVNLFENLKRRFNLSLEQNGERFEDFL